jgi:hypothetical protein
MLISPFEISLLDSNYLQNIVLITTVPHPPLKYGIPPPTTACKLSKPDELPFQTQYKLWTYTRVNRQMRNIILFFILFDIFNNYSYCQQLLNIIGNIKR